MLFCYSGYVAHRLKLRGSLISKTANGRDTGVAERDVQETIWDGNEDILDLAILFGEKVYVPEKWDWNVKINIFL